MAAPAQLLDQGRLARPRPPGQQHPHPRDASHRDDEREHLGLRLPGFALQAAQLTGARARHDLTERLLARRVRDAAVLDDEGPSAPVEYTLDALGGDVGLTVVA